MADTPDVWEASESIEGGRASAKPSTSAELPPVVDLFMATFDDFKDNFVGFFLTGLGTFGVAFAVLFVIIGLSVVPLLAGAVSENEILMVVGFLTYFIGILAGTVIVMGPTMYAVFSAANAHLEGDEDALGITGGLRYLFKRPIGAMGYQLAATGLSMVGMLFFIIGAWIVQIALGFALPGMVTHELGVIDSIKRSVAHFREHPKWHLGFWGLGLAVMMIAGNIPFIGYMIGLPFFAVYTLRGYRAAFPAEAESA